MLKSAVIGSGGAGRNILSSLLHSEIPLYLMNSSKDGRFEPIFSSKSEILASISTDKSVKRGMMETERSAHSILKSYDIVFSVSGLGGFYGTAVPVMLTRLSGNVIPVFTLPFSIEGEKRRKSAEKGMKMILSECRWAVALENDMLLKIAPNATLDGAFRAMNLLVSEIITGISRAFDSAGQVIGALEGRVGVGIGTGKGMNSQEKALREVLNSPWLDLSDRAMLIIKGGREDDFLWIREKLEGMGTEISAEAHMDGRADEIELLVLS